MEGTARKAFALLDLNLLYPKPKSFGMTSNEQKLREMASGQMPPEDVASMEGSRSVFSSSKTNCQLVENARSHILFGAKAEALRSHMLRDRAVDFLGHKTILENRYPTLVSIQIQNSYGFHPKRSSNRSRGELFGLPAKWIVFIHWECGNQTDFVGLSIGEIGCIISKR